MRRRIYGLGRLAEGGFENFAVAEKRRRCKHVLDGFKFGIAALAQITIERVAAFFAASLRREHAQVDTAGTAGEQLRVGGDQDGLIDRLGAARRARRETLGQNTRLEIRDQIGDDGLNIDRIDDRRAKLLHFADRLVGDADAIAIG